MQKLRPRVAGKKRRTFGAAVIYRNDPPVNARKQRRLAKKHADAMRAVQAPKET